jgi:multidrug efflux system membrane fusion protein
VDSSVKTTIRVVVGIAALAGVGFGVRIYTTRASQAKATATKEGGAATPDRVVAVKVVTAAQRDMPIYLEGLGNVLASATVTVKTQVDGRIDRIAFREGQEVKKGDLLAQIDPRPFHAQLDAAQAALTRDNATLLGAVRNLERYGELHKSGLSSQQQVDDQAALVAQLRGTTASDNAAIETARLNLDYAHITSPVDGVTGIRLVDQGNVIHASDPTGIVVLTTLDPIAVIFTLPQDNLPAILTEVAGGTVGVQALSRDGTTLLAEGALAVIDNQINSATATIRLKAMFANPKRLLWPNAFVKTRLLLSVRKNAVVIPAAVVQHGPDGDFAYAVGPDQTAVVKAITVDVMQGDQVIVGKGLQAGDVVVLDGQSQLKPGAKVSTQAPAASSATPASSAAPAGSGAPRPSGSAKAGPAAGAKQ